MQMFPRLNKAVTNTQIALVFIVAAIASAPALAATEDGQQMAWATMGMNLFGGLAVFLFGMGQMAEALKAVAGERMKLILARLTTNRFMGALTGAFVTTVIQSSSVTTVLVVGFITAGLMSMAQSIGVIMGANIGTTVTAQIVAFKVTKAALLIVAVGFSMLFFSKHEKIKQYGAMIMGLGLIFFGMAVMSDAMQPLRTYGPFLDLMVKIENPLVGILIAAAFTGLIQSSSATTGIVIVMASQGFITLPAGIALAFGANIGTCITALLASIGKPREAVRAGVVHILFNVSGVLIWVGIIDQLAAVVTSLSPAHAGLSGADRLAAETPRQIANAHTIFNVANTLIFIWFTGPIARLVERLVPDKPFEETVVIKPKFLSDELLETPSLALERVRLEIGHLGERVNQMVRRLMPTILTSNRQALMALAKLDDEVDILHGHIVTYIGKLSQKALTQQQTKDFVRLMEAANGLENIGDIIETDLVALGTKRIQKGVSVSKKTQQVLMGLHEKVAQTVEQAIQAVMEDDEQSGQDVIAMKAEIASLATAAAAYEAKRLVADEPNRLLAYSLEVDVIERLNRIYYFAKRMAKTVAPEPALDQAA